MKRQSGLHGAAGEVEAVPMNATSPKHARTMEANAGLSSPVVENRVELPGVSITLNTGQPKGLIDIARIEEDHVLTLYLMPLPNIRNCYIPRDKVTDPIEVGALSLRPAGVPWRIVTVGLPYRALIVRITPQKYYEVTGCRDHDWDFPGVTNISGTPMNVTMLRMALELNKPGFESKRLMELLTESLIIDLARFAEGGASESESSHGGLSPEQISLIDEYLEKSAGAGTTIAKLSKLLKLSSRHLTRMFKVSTGKTIHAYIAEARMRKAISLLSLSDLPLKEIAYKLGYAGVGSFSAAFRDVTGISPGTYRKNRRDAVPRE